MRIWIAALAACSNVAAQEAPDSGVDGGICVCPGPGLRFESKTLTPELCNSSRSGGDLTLAWPGVDRYKVRTLNTIECQADICTVISFPIALQDNALVLEGGGPCNLVAAGARVTITLGIAE